MAVSTTEAREGGGLDWGSWSSYVEGSDLEHKSQDLTKFPGRVVTGADERTKSRMSLRCLV